MRATPIPGPTRHNAFHQRLRFTAPELAGDHYAYECDVDDVCWCACHRTGPKSPSCTDCARLHDAERGL